MKLTVFQDRRGEWRWRLTARNGRVVADCGEGYKRRADLERALKRVIGGLIDGVAAFYTGPKAPRRP
jgi:uncharacterized protein YegP (UPF0339 family)